MASKTIKADAGALDRIHVPFVVASLLFALFGGFSLAISLPLQAIFGSLNASWVAHAQVHGHLQVVGFAGLFVVGMAHRLAPRFGGRRSMSLPGAERWVLWLFVTGLLGRMIGQPLAEAPAFGALMVAGAASEATGAALFLLMVCLTLSNAVRARQPHAVLLVGAATGLLAQAVLGLWWLSEMAADSRAFLGSAESAVLLHVQFFGVLLPAILGVGMRSFPTFFGRKPLGHVTGNLIAATSIVGITIWTVGGTLAAQRDGDWWLWTVSGQMLTGLAVIGAILAFGPWRQASRLAAASKGLAWSIHPAVLWLAATGVLLLVTAVQSAVAGHETGSSTLDAIRHMFALGVITLAIVGMAQLILPEFASERLVRKPGGWRGPFFGVMLSTAAMLRGVVLLGEFQGEARWWAMAIAGMLAWVALAVFAWLLWRATRSHRAYLQRISRFREHPIPLIGEGT